MTDLELIDWDDWRKCTVCFAKIGRPCETTSGMVVNGRPDKIVVHLSKPHTLRKRRTGR